MKKFPIFFVLLIIFGSGLVTTTYAQAAREPVVKPSQGVEDRKDLIDKAKKENSNFEKNTEDSRSYRCSTTSAKMDLVVENYRKNFERHLEIYRNIVGRVDELLTSLEAEGYDVTVARDENSKFSAQVEALNNDFNSFESEMDLAQEKLCEDDVSGFRESLAQSRNQLKVIRNNMLNLRNSFNQNVKPELIKLKQQVAEDNVTSEDTEQEDTTEQQEGD